MTTNCLNMICDSQIDRVWRGEDASSHRRMLIKELTSEACRESVYRRRLEVEVKFLNELKNARYLSVQNHDVDEGLICYEDVQCSLEQLIARFGRFENDMVANVLVQVCEALSILNENGMAHGSLSSQKVFVDPQGFVKLGDFVGYRLENDRPIGERHRRPRYQAPEILDSCFGDCGPFSDLYNLGHLALEMLAGPEYPHLFGFSNDRDTASPKWLQWHSDPHRTLENWLDSLPHVNKSLAMIVDQLIVKSVDGRRIRSASSLIDRITDLGLQSTRVLPPYQPVTPVKPAITSAYCPPVRIAGSVLTLRPKLPEMRKKRFVGRAPVLIGSETDLPLSIPDASVEPRHALVACQRTEWYLYDLKSTSGVLLNSSKIRQWGGPLRRGDEIRLGAASLLVDIEHRGTALLGTFDIQRRIHVGGQGELYYAVWNRPTGARPVALRLLPEEFSKQRDPLRRFLRAMSESGKLRHPTILRLFKAGLVRRAGRDQWFLATEFMSGRSLRDRLAKSRNESIPLQQVRDFAIDIGASLAVLEKHGLIHRNINPSCILFTTARVEGTGRPKFRDVAKLGDFLLSRPEVLESYYQITRGQLSLGDFPYQAPELLMENKQVDSSCDIFGLAACMFEAVTGRLPVATGRSLAQTVSSFVNLKWPSPSTFRPGLPVEWDRVLNRSLSIDPKQRYLTVTEFLSAVKRLPISSK